VALLEAYAACQRLAATHYENFPVASRLLPAAMRPHVAAVYAFARVADDFADEDGTAAGDRIARLDDWLARVRAAAGVAEPVEAAPPDVPGIEARHVFEALAHTIRACSLPVSLFEDLLSAFRQDVSVRRYSTWTDVLDYCRRSADPVGRLVLRIAGYRDGALDESSDAFCTALQLTNFWQDLEVDWTRGRLYVPAEEWTRAGALEADLDARTITPAWRAALAGAAAVTRRLFANGRPVCDGVSGRLRYELRATWLGATRILDRLEAGGFDVFRARPTLGRRDAAAIAVGVAAWQWVATPARSL
jgi:phytoene synthase